ncbi:dodecin [Gordonia terrae]|uniref:dodecin n=1 Tax=Gordonia terrae TaxID=2055 RepID=UPI003F6D6188
MSDNVYRVIEVVGSSDSGTDDAIRNAIARAAQTVNHLDWFEVTETRGHIENGQIAHFQVTLKVGFKLEGSDDAT